MKSLSLAALAVSSLVLAAPAGAQNCANTSVGFTPLNDLGAGTYQGEQGGLYPGGSNLRPTPHEIGGLAQVVDVVPRDAQGNPDPNGRIVVMSLGMSNTAAHWGGFRQVSEADPARNPAVFLFQGAQGGVAAEDMDDPNDGYWTSVLPGKFNQAGVTPDEVQVVWLLQANRSPQAGFPAHAQNLKSQMASILRILKDTCPNARLVYVSSRIYAGYATTQLNPEPWAYEQAFAVKWLIQDQIDGDPGLNYDPDLGPVEAPWIAWGTYNWADGLTPRSDGLIWECADLRPDGTHPSAQGTLKNAGLLSSFFHGDSTARTWYLAEPDPVPYGEGKTTSLGLEPTIQFTGSPSLAANDFVLHLRDGMPNRLVVLFRGTYPQNKPFFGGRLYAEQPLKRLGARVASGLGAAHYPISIDSTMVGQTRSYGFWFRDGQHPDGTGVGISSALQVRFR